MAGIRMAVVAYRTCTGISYPPPGELPPSLPREDADAARAISPPILDVDMVRAVDDVTVLV